MGLPLARRAKRRKLAEQRPDVVEELHRELWDFESLWAKPLSWRDMPRDIKQGEPAMKERKNEKEEWKDIAFRREFLKTKLPGRRKCSARIG